MSTEDNVDIDSTEEEVKTKPTTITAEEAKKKRAERFGIPVSMTEAEKKRKRSERFGDKATKSTQNGETPQNKEAIARAKRFGSILKEGVQGGSKKFQQRQPVGAQLEGNKNKTWKKEDEEKKKLRAERFGAVDSKKPKVN